MSDANDIRGEVDLVLGAQTFVLRPSYQAIIAMEKKTGRSLYELAALAERNMLDQDAQAIIATELIRAWGRGQEVGEYTTGKEKSLITSARGAGVESIGERLFSVGVLAVQPRLALVLGLAASGGCLPSGELKTTGMMTTETPAAD